MKASAKYVVVMAAGLLSLQLAVVAPAQEGASGSVMVAGSSALPASRGSAESSRDLDQTGGSTSRDEATTNPGKAGGMGDPFVGGERHPLYRLSKSDVVQANFTFSPDYNQTLTVQPDGFVTLKGAGTILAEGLTLPELQEAMAKAYSSFLHEPEISLALKEFDKPFFLASGEVTRPGKYELRGDLTVNEAVAIAGGFTKQARHSQVVLFRRLSTEVAETHVLNLRKMLDSRDLREDMHLRPGDFIFVPESRITKIRRFVPASSLSWYMNPLQF
ncbi:MAG TPA: polysaccharide biosynthesis/export family protein [Terriglobales bacterium]|nr:polysaccharide biosynthesis/export family protein [Terriglobales bacterium]